MSRVVQQTLVSFTVLEAKDTRENSLLLTRYGARSCWLQSSSDAVKSVARGVIAGVEVYFVQTVASKNLVSLCKLSRGLVKVELGL